MFEVDEAAKIISNSADRDANIIFGAVIKEELADQLKITVVATGFDETRSRIGKMNLIYTTPIQGVVSETPERKQDTVSDDEDDEEGKKDDDDPFGDKFEIPAFLRKI